jgi:hypothetical protein
MTASPACRVPVAQKPANLLWLWTLTVSCEPYLARLPRMHPSLAHLQGGREGGGYSRHMHTRVYLHSSISLPTIDFLIGMWSLYSSVDEASHPC